MKTSKHAPFRPQDVEVAVALILQFTAEGEPLWRREGGEPALLPQDHLRLRNHLGPRWDYNFFWWMRSDMNGSAWRRGTHPTEFSRRVASVLAERYPSRFLLKPPSAPL